MASGSDLKSLVGGRGPATGADLKGLASPAEAPPIPEPIQPELAPTREPTAGEAFGRGALSRFLGNLASTPAALGNPVVSALTPRTTRPGQIPDPLQAISGAIRGLTGGAVDPTASAEQQRQQGGLIPRVAGEDALGGAEAAAAGAVSTARGAEPDFSGRFAESQQRTAEAERTSPIAFGAGGVGGDIATLMLGRPARGQLRALEGRRASLPQSTLPPGLRRELDDIVRSKFGRNLERAGIRIGEAGLEGATLALLDDGDPVKAAAFAAAGQAIGGAALGLNRLLIGRNLTDAAVRISTTFVGLTAAIGILKEKIPGGRDRVLESFETSSAVMAAAMGLGSLATIAGLGRQGGRFAENLPRLADALTAIPRGAFVSAIKDLTSNDGPDIESTIQAMSENPDAFGQAAMRRVDRAFRQGRLKAEIDKLMQDRGFRRRLDELSR